MRRATRGPSCSGSAPATPTSRWSWPGPTPRPGSRWRRCTRRWPPPTRRSSSPRWAPRTSTASTWCSWPCPTASPSSWSPTCVGRVGLLVDLSADFRLRDAGALPALVRRRPRRARAAGRVRLRAPRAVPGRARRGPPGRRARVLSRPPPRWPWPRSSGPGVDRADRASSSTRPAACRAPGASCRTTTALRHRRRGLHRLRPARTTATPPRSSRPSGPRCCSRRTWPP